MTRPCFHTPRIEKISVFNPAYDEDFLEFLDSETDAIRFVPVGDYTMSSMWTPTYSVAVGSMIRKVVGCGRASFYGQFDDGYASISENGGVSKIFITGTDGFVEDTFEIENKIKGFVFKGLEFDVTGSSLDGPMIGIYRASFLEIDDVGFSTYYATTDSGEVIDVTGSSDVKIENISIHGFGGSTSNRDDFLINTDYCYNVSMKDLYMIGLVDAGNWPTPVSIFQTRQNRTYKISNCSIQGYGTTSVNTNILKCGTGNALGKHLLFIDGLEIGPTMRFGNTQKGAFEFVDDRYVVELRGINNDATSSYNQFRISGSTYPSSMIVRGEIGGTNSAFRPPVGIVSSPFDTTWNLITPYSCGGSSASVPVASTNYVCEVRKAQLYVDGGTDVTVSIDTTILPYNSNGFTYHLQVGQTISFGGFSVAPSVDAYFEA